MNTEAKPPLTSLPEEMENRLLGWIQEHGRSLAYLALLTIALSVGVGKFFHSRGLDKRADFIRAQLLIERLQAKSVDVMGQQEGATQEMDTLIADLDAIFSNYPELRQKYDGVIATSFIKANRGKEAVPYAERALARVSKLTPQEFSTFSKSSLLLAQGLASEGLELSQTLSQQSSNELLSLFNLARLSLLNTDLSAWSDLNSSLEAKPNTSFTKHWTEGSVSLNSFFAEKKS